MKRFNPYIAAFQAAADELTSPEAKQYYSIRAQQDIQAVLVVAVHLGAIAFGLGQKARDLYESAKSKAEPMPEVKAQSVEVEIVSEVEPKEIRLLSPAPIAPSAVPPVEAWLTRQILYPAIASTIALPPINPVPQPVVARPVEEPKPVVKSARTRKPRKTKAIAG
jgi:hypothetical protein